MEQQPLAPPPKARRPAYRRIADGLRAEIASGKLTPGTQLPSTDDLAVIWNSSTFTVHSALVSLVKEGWVERLNGSGTYVAETQNRFTCAAIYHGVDICRNEHPPFQRSVHTSVLERLGALEKQAEIFIDPRPLKAQGTVLPALADAILHRRVQCLIAPTINDINSPALERLTVPTAFIRPTGTPNRANFDEENFFRESVHRLTLQGCRSVGLITNVLKFSLNGEADVYNTRFHQLFRQAVRGENLITKDAWVRSPTQDTNNLPRLGYQEFVRLWQLSEKPDGLIVFPDFAATGVITAVLETGLRSVMDGMKFVFHRNAQIDYLCPFPVTWAISDENRLADALVGIVEKQFRGEKVTPALVPYVWEYAEAGSLGSAI